jgi:hypothetical protein
MVFNSSLSGAVVSLDSGADSVTFVTQVVGASTMFGGSGTQTVNFSKGADLVTFDGTFGAGSIIGGSGADTLVFQSGAMVSGSTTVKTQAGADSLVFRGNEISGSFGLGADADFVSASSLTLGNSGVSFFSGSGNDTFDISSISGALGGGTGATAYFWNEEGTDSIVIGGAISTALKEGANVNFGITSAASMNISFGTSALTGEITDGFSGGSVSNSFLVHNNLVTFGFGSKMITMTFVGGGHITLAGGQFSAEDATNIFGGNVAAGSAGTGLFGIAGSIPTFS